MTGYKKHFLGSAAAIAMIAGLPAAAFAFDEVNWVWDKQVTETVDIDVDINAELNPTGLTQVEKLQIQIGDVNASSIVHDISNNQPELGEGDGSGTVTINETFVVDTFEDEDNPGMDIPGIGPLEGDDPGNGIQATFDGGEIIEIDDADDEVILTFTIDGEVPFEASELVPLDAITELPTVESIATAVGNNQSINSDTATMLHDGQLLFDQGDVATGEPGDEDLIGALGAVLAGGALADNTHTAMAGAASVLALTGTINKANVDATSEIYNILNARVDSSATAVGNNIAVNVNADGEPTGDSVLIADITQFAAADVSATSSVYEVSVNDYINMGAPEVNPLVSSVATAVGNNVSINVGNVGQ